LKLLEKLTSAAYALPFTIDGRGGEGEWTYIKSWLRLPAWALETQRRIILKVINCFEFLKNLVVCNLYAYSAHL
jgi:hypothetical protein